MPHRRSHFFRGLVLTVIAVALPLLGMIGHTLSVQAGKDQALLKATLREKATVAARLTENTLSQLKFVLAFMGTSTGLSVTNPLLCHKLMRDVPRLETLVVDIALFDTEGRTICQSIAPPGQEGQYLGEPWFQEAMTKRETFITKPFVGKRSQRSIVAITHPVFDAAGKRVGMLGAALSTEVLADRLLPEIELPLSNFGIIRSDGTLIAVRGDVENWLGRQMRPSIYRAFVAAREEPMSFTGQVDGVARFGISAAIPDFDLHVVLSVPQQAVLEPARARAYESAAIAGAITLTALCAAWFGAKRLNRPISSLTNTARAFADGQFHASADESLPGEFRMLARELNKAIAAARDAEEATRGRAAAEAASQAKSDFLANMSHEIRTPLNAILGMTDLALRQTLPPKSQDYLIKVQRAARGLLGIINDILDFSKVEAGKLELERVEFSIQSVLDRVTTVVGLQARANQQELLFDLAPGVTARMVGDPLRLEQVLVNLCGNAVKFAGQGELVLLTVQPGPPGFLCFSIRDTGPGMTEEQCSQLFKPFGQLDASTTRRHGGTGLGLAICRQLVELMGGEIGVRSSPGEGSEFFFNVRHEIGSSHDWDEKPDPTRYLNQRVLIVDDRADARRIISTELRRLGASIEMAHSGQEAMALSSEALHRFDAIMVDAELADVDSFELVNLLKASGNSNQRHLMMAAYGDDDVIRRASEAGLSGCLVKPFSRSALLGAVDLMLAQAADILTVHATAQPASAPAELSGVRVLLVEDTEFNQIVANDLLGAVAGMEVSIASNGSEALRKLSDDEFDIVLMDVQMPGMDGYEVTRKIRQQARFTQLPIIAMTAYAMTRDRKRCMEAGMNDFITKPLDPSALFTVISRWIERRPDDSRHGYEGPAWNGHTRTGSAVDFTEGLRRCLGRQELLDRIANRFIQTKADDAVNIRKAMHDGDLEAVALLTHNTASSAGTLGASRLSELARQLEQATQPPQEGTAINALVDAYAVEHELVITELRQYTRNRTSAAS